MLALKTIVSPRKTIRQLSLVSILIMGCALPAISQKSQPDDSTPPKYDVHTETKMKGTVDEIKVLSFASRKDFTQLTLKSGDQTVYIYVCPKPFQDEMGINFAKGDEIAVTGFKYKQETSDMILARELVKGTDTLMFRDDKGQPVWDPRTGK
ncbi:MAG: hypothetical protein ABSF97_12140 [Candidatus Sulfotelmatobacter sp.]|jgi:hypothetical protein